MNIQSTAPSQTISFVWIATLALVISAAVGVLAAVSSLSSLSSLNAAADQRKAALLGRLHLEQLLALMTDLETGQRGFVVTGRDDFLEPYHRAVVGIPSAFAQVVASVFTPLPASVNWTDFRQLIARRQALAAAAVAGRQLRGNAKLEDFTVFIDGKRTMDEFRAQVDALKSHQAAHVGALDAEMRRVRDLATVYEWLSAVLLTALIAGALTLLLIERSRRLRLESTLRENNALLEQRVRERTAALAVARGQIQQYAVRLEDTMEAERRRISREVHDQLGQIFTAVKMIVRTMKPDALALEQRAALADALDLGVATTRRIAAELRPPLLDDLGLVAALDHFAKQVAAPRGIKYAVEVSDWQLLTESQTLQIFRVAQEALLNAARHASAHMLTVTGQAEGALFELRIEDDGDGFNPDSVREGALGLIGLRERAAVMGGAAQIGRRAGGGTYVSVRFPHGAAALAGETQLGIV